MKYRIILRKIKNTSQGLKLAKILSDEFLISQEKAYSFIVKAPLTIFDKINEEKLNSIEKKLKEIEAIYTVEEIGIQNSISQKEPLISLPENTLQKEDTKQKNNTIFYILLGLVSLLFLSSIVMFSFFYFQKNPIKSENKQSTAIKNIDNTKRPFTKKLKSFFASDYTDADILEMILDGKFEQTESILNEKIKKKGESSKINKLQGILYFTWAYAEENKEKWDDYGKNLDDLWNTQKINKSLDCFEKALSLDKNDPEILNYIGVIFYEKGWYNRAEKMYRQAITLDSKYIEAKSNLGILFNSLGNLEDAEQIFEEIIKMDNSYKSAFLNLGLVSNRLKKQEKAIYYLKHYIKFRPADENLFSAIQLLKTLEKEGKAK